jgi:hypothetical protein
MGNVILSMHERIRLLRDGPSVTVTPGVAGLNSTPALIGLFVFFICFRALNVSYKRATRSRDKKGEVRSMKSVTFKFSGRKLAAPLATLHAAIVGCAAICGGSG